MKGKDNSEELDTNQKVSSQSAHILKKQDQMVLTRLTFLVKMVIRP